MSGDWSAFEHVARHRCVACSWQVLTASLIIEAKCVTYATYTVVSDDNDGTFPYIVQVWIVVVQPRPSRPRRGAFYTKLTACDLHVPMRVYRSVVMVSLRTALPGRWHHCAAGFAARNNDGAMHDGMATKNTTYNWVCKPHYIHTI